MLDGGEGAVDPAVEAVIIVVPRNIEGETQGVSGIREGEFAVRVARVFLEA